MPLEDQNKYAWSVKQDEKQIIGFFRKLAKPNDTLDRYLSLSNLDQNADYIINQKIRLVVEYLLILVCVNHINSMLLMAIQPK